MCSIKSFTASYSTLNPTQLIIMPSYSNNNQPPSLPRIQPCTQTPQEAVAQMNSLLCVQNTWHPPPQKESPLIFDQYTSKTTEPTPKGHTIAGMFYTHQILHGHTHMEKATLSTPQLHYPSVPMTHAHPNPPLSPQQWTCLTPKNTACQTMACPIGWNYGNKLGIGGKKRWMDRRDWKQNSMVFQSLMHLFAQLLSFII